eukprot:PhF_6_TR10538/c1_g1_i1/m.16646
MSSEFDVPVGLLTGSSAHALLCPAIHLLYSFTNLRNSIVMYAPDPEEDAPLHSLFLQMKYLQSNSSGGEPLIANAEKVSNSVSGMLDTETPLTRLLMQLCRPYGDATRKLDRVMGNLGEYEVPMTYADSASLSAVLSMRDDGFMMSDLMTVTYALDSAGPLSVNPTIERTVQLQRNTSDIDDDEDVEILVYELVSVVLTSRGSGLTSRVLQRQSPNSQLWYCCEEEHITPCRGNDINALLQQYETTPLKEPLFISHLIYVNSYATQELYHTTPSITSSVNKIARSSPPLGTFVNVNVVTSQAIELEVNERQWDLCDLGRSDKVLRFVFESSNYVRSLLSRIQVKLGIPMEIQRYWHIGGDSLAAPIETEGTFQDLLVLSSPMNPGEKPCVNLYLEILTTKPIFAQSNLLLLPTLEPSFSMSSCVAGGHAGNAVVAASCNPICCTTPQDRSPWWSAKLNTTVQMSTITLHSSRASAHPLDNIMVRVVSSTNETVWESPLVSEAVDEKMVRLEINPPVRGDRVVVFRPNPQGDESEKYLSLCEVVITGDVRPPAAFSYAPPPPPTRDSVLLFLKGYNPITSHINFLGTVVVDKTRVVQDLIPTVQQLMHVHNNAFRFYVEHTNPQGSDVSPISEASQPREEGFHKVKDVPLTIQIRHTTLRNGGILIITPNFPASNKVGRPLIQYLKELWHTRRVTFQHKNVWESAKGPRHYNVDFSAPVSVREVVSTWLLPDLDLFVPEQITLSQEQHAPISGTDEHNFCEVFGSQQHRELIVSYATVKEPERVSNVRISITEEDSSVVAEALYMYTNGDLVSDLIRQVLAQRNAVPVSSSLSDYELLATEDLDIVKIYSPRDPAPFCPPKPKWKLEVRRLPPRPPSRPDSGETYHLRSLYQTTGYNLPSDIFLPTRRVWISDRETFKHAFNRITEDLDIPLAYFAETQSRLFFVNPQTRGVMMFETHMNIQKSLMRYDQFDGNPAGIVLTYNTRSLSGGVD